MFFINAQELGEDFFAPQNPAEMPRDFFYRPYNQQEAGSIDWRQKRFTDWVLGTAIPLITVSNPGINEYLDQIILQNMGEVNQRDIHRDPPTYSMRRAYITLGLNMDGSTASTILAKSRVHEGKKIGSIEPEILDADFLIPEQRYATVFMPEYIPHTTPDSYKNRTLYKAVAWLADTQLVTPNSDLCLELAA